MGLCISIDVLLLWLKVSAFYYIHCYCLIERWRFQHLWRIQ